MAAPQPVLVLPEARPAEVLAGRYSHVRRVSLEICEPLQTEDFVVQSMPDASPTKWHLAHTSWFFEQFLLKPLLPGYRAFHPHFEYLFNSYYQTVGRMHERPQRGLLTRPTVAEVLQYREHVDEHMQQLFRVDGREDERSLSICHARPQSRAAASGADAHGHQASVLVQSAAARVSRAGARDDSERRRGAAAFHLVRRRRRARSARAASTSVSTTSCRVIARSSSRMRSPIGWSRTASISSSSATAAIAARSSGCRTAGRTVSEQGWTRPIYWMRGARSRIHAARPAAAAICRARLSHQLLRSGCVRALGRCTPADAKRNGSSAAESLPVASAICSNTRRAASDGCQSVQPGLKQMFGDVWEWTASPYVAYPGYRRRPARSANTTASSCATSWCCAAARASRRRITSARRYRNFFYRQTRAGSSWACDSPAICEPFEAFTKIHGKASEHRIRAPIEDGRTHRRSAGRHAQAAKELSPVWFYDELGSFLFDNICELPEYYLTRTELQIMREHAAEMAQHIGPDAAASSSSAAAPALKTRVLLESPGDAGRVRAGRHRARSSARSRQCTRARLSRRCASIPVCADFTRPFDLPVASCTPQTTHRLLPRLDARQLRSEAARELLARMRQIIGKNGAVLIGIDLKKDPRILERAYDDRAGVTAEFNLNALRHMNRELGADFDLDAFEHLAVWVEDQSRIEMHLVSKRDQVVHIGDTASHCARRTPAHGVLPQVHARVVRNAGCISTSAGHPHLDRRREKVLCPVARAGETAVTSKPPYPAAAHPAGLNSRNVDAGYFSSFAAGRRGRCTSSPPQFGHVPRRTCVAQSSQNVHSKVQIVACVESGGKSRSQHSQFGRSSSTRDLQQQPDCQRTRARYCIQPTTGRFRPLIQVAPTSGRKSGHLARTADARGHICPRQSAAPAASGAAKNTGFSHCSSHRLPHAGRWHAPCNTSGECPRRGCQFSQGVLPCSTSRCLVIPSAMPCACCCRSSSSPPVSPAARSVCSRWSRARVRRCPSWRNRGYGTPKSLAAPQRWRLRVLRNL